MVILIQRRKKNSRNKFACSHLSTRRNDNVAKIRLMFLVTFVQQMSEGDTALAEIDTLFIAELDQHVCSQLWRHAS